MYHIALTWLRTTTDFKYESYNRTHRIRFGSGTEIEASSAPEYVGDADKVNPEETFLAALSSCHMLTFLAIAAKSRYTVDKYQDDADAELGKNSEGKIAVARATLRPRVTFGGENRPDSKKIRELHEAAHRNCFIANSVKCPVNVEPR